MFSCSIAPDGNGFVLPWEHAGALLASGAMLRSDHYPSRAVAALDKIALLNLPLLGSVLLSTIHALIKITSIIWLSQCRVGNQFPHAAGYLVCNSLVLSQILVLKETAYSDISPQ